MIKRIKSLTNTEDKKRLMSNFFSLSVLQGANYILPLITLPYLVRVLGVEYFGLLAFAAATVTYFSILTDYGFNLTATREISIHRDNKAKVIEIFSSVMTIKVILMFVSFLLLTILVFSFEKFSKDALVYFLTFGTVVGQVLFPIWFFQGMEQMKYITYLNILSKVIFTIAIFLFVQEQSDFYLVPLLTSVGFLVAGIWSLYLVKKEFGVWFELQTIDTIKHHLIEGWHVFVSRIYVNLYIGTNTILLGIFTNNTITGYYAIAEKIILAIGGIFDPFNQTMFPYLAKVYKKNISEFINLVKQISFYMMIVTFLTAIICYIWGEDIVYIITGTYNKEIVLLFSIFIFRLINMPFGSFYSNCLIIMHSNKYFIKVMNYTVAFYFLFVPISLWIFNIYIMTASFVFVLFLHVVLLRYYLTKSFQSIQKEDK